MIEFTKAFKAAGGVYDTLEEAQLAELSELFKDQDLGVTPKGLAGVVLDNSDKIVDILTTTKESRPKARKVNGGSKTRKPKVISASETAA